MRVEIKLDPNILEEIAIIHAKKMTPKILALVEAFEGAQEKASLLVAKSDDKVFIIEPDQIDIIRTEGGEVKIYNQLMQEYSTTKPLHEILEMLPSNFVRISKSAIVNINRVDHLSNSFNRTMYIIMKNGISNYISRNFWGDFKKRLGI
ncbi:MAG: LytTR family transcriptional regulator [Defluviitaleaceae bacterium]|nr:LytTR family transcriptional regulator [Defluviitaleaceae bacterium]